MRTSFYFNKRQFLIAVSTLAVLTAQSQNVGINTTGAGGHPSAMLDVSADNKGVLLPNVTLTSVTDATTVSSPATGLMVWNTGTGFGTAGYYYNSGTSGSPNWERITTGTFSGGTGINLSGGGVITNTGVLSLAGTSNQINVSASSGNITLSTPQNIHTGASPTFVGGTFTGLSTAGIVTNTAGGVLGTTTLANLMADLAPGAGLTGTTIYDGSSAQTFSVASGNGLTTDAGQDRVELGGTLDQNTTISKGNFGLTFNQTGTGDFHIQDNGVSSFFVYGNDNASTDGFVGIGTSSPTTKLHVEGSTFIPAGQSYWIGNNSDAGSRLRMHLSGVNSYIDYATGALNFRNGTDPAVVLQSDGDLHMVSDNSIHMPNNVGYVVNRNQQTFANTNTTYVDLAGTTTALQVDANDIVVVNVTLKFKFTGGSNNDDVRFRLNITGCINTTQAETYEFENFDNDRNEFQSVAMQFVYQPACTGTLQFNIQMDAFSDADDAAAVGDLVITAHKY